MAKLYSFSNVILITPSGLRKKNLHKVLVNTRGFVLWIRCPDLNRYGVTTEEF